MNKITNPLSNPNQIARAGFYIAMLTSVITLVTFTIAFLTPPLSGPFCRGECFEYPYTDIAERFPRDYYWMYLSMIVSLLYLFLMIVIHYHARPDKKIYSHTGLGIALISAAIMIPLYFTQVTVIQPSLMKKEFEGLALWSQFNPHGMFIALEEISYWLMNISFFVVIPVFNDNRKFSGAIRLTYLIGFILAAVAFALISLQYGIMREYIFEVAIISIVWFQLIISSALLTFRFRNMM